MNALLALAIFASSSWAGGPPLNAFERGAREETLRDAVAGLPVAAAGLPAPGPSTALLERGALLEAFSVAGHYAELAAAQADPSSGFAAGGSRTPVRTAAPPEASPAPLWWAWFALPLFIAAVRGLL